MSSLKTLITDGRVFTVSRDKTLKMWSADSLELLATCTEASDELACLAVSASFVATGGDDEMVRIYTRSDLRIRHALAHPDTSRVLSLAMDDVRVIAGYDDGQLMQWRLPDGEPGRPLPHDHEDEISALHILTTRRAVSCAWDGKLM